MKNLNMRGDGSDTTRQPLLLDSGELRNFTARRFLVQRRNNSSVQALGISTD